MKKAKNDDKNESFQNSANSMPDEDLTIKEAGSETDVKSSGKEGEAKDSESGGKADAESDPRDQQLADLTDKFLRLAAEYDNYRRRSQKEKEALYADSVASVAQAWLPVIDNLERAAASAAEYQNEEAAKIRSGVDMIIQQAREAMSSLGIAEIAALGQPFDPNAMEAIMHIEDESAGECQVVEVFKKGYARGDKIIRHAIVKVAN